VLTNVIADGELAHPLADLDYLAGTFTHRNAPVRRLKNARDDQLVVIVKRASVQAYLHLACADR
jgi:hypothetical protein